MNSGFRAVDVYLERSLRRRLQTFQKDSDLKFLFSKWPLAKIALARGQGRHLLRLYSVLTIERDPVSQMKRSVANRSTTLRREKLASQGRDAHPRSQAHGDVGPSPVWMLVAMSLTSSWMLPPSLLDAGRKRGNRGDGWLPPNYRETTFKDSHVRKSDTDSAQCPS